MLDWLDRSEAAKAAAAKREVERRLDNDAEIIDDVLKLVRVRHLSPEGLKRLRQHLGGV